MSSSTNSYARVWDAGLDDLPDAPRETLYARGEHVQEALDAPTVAVVGARACSSYGAHVARRLGCDLAAAGVTVVSGLARGVDAEAHRGALDAAGRTVAVLGCGIDRDHPAAHAELARRIAETGGIVSEYAPGVEPAPWRFPARKRQGLDAKRVSLNHAVRIRRARRIRRGDVVPVWSRVRGGAPVRVTD